MSRWNNGRGYVSRRRVLAFHAELARLRQYQPELMADFLASRGCADPYVIADVAGDVAVPQGGGK